MTKIIEVKGSVQEWVERNSMQIHMEVLDACERGLESNENEVDVIILKTNKGITKFVLNTPGKITRALELSLESFVKTEEYELAARARDCIFGWNEKQQTICQNQ
jgi:hypothetical protein